MFLASAPAPARMRFAAAPALAVVVPFWKPKYFGELLSALAAQSYKRFTVYVGNDGSAASPSHIIGCFRSVLDIRYHRFGTRLGHIDLAGQWNRCVGISGEEEWLWVVPDDDLPSSNCVAAIHEAMEIADQVGANLIHLPFVEADRDGRSLHAPHVWPRTMNIAPFYLSQVRGDAPGLALGNVVFRRKAFDAAGGFVSFPQGWGSDHATALAVAAGGPIVSIRDAFVAFRMSGENISCNRDDGYEKMQARVLFARWFLDKGKDWFESGARAELLKWFYFKGEIYAINIWRYDMRMYGKLFELATICNVPRHPLQKCSILLRSILSSLRQ